MYSMNLNIKLIKFPETVSIIIKYKVYEKVVLKTKVLRKELHFD